MDNKFEDMILKGEKAIKTSFWSLKFTPDFLSAVTYFSQAGEGLVVKEQWDRAEYALSKAIECNSKLEESYSEGRNKLLLAETKVHLGKIDEALKLTEQARTLFVIDGKVDICIKRIHKTANKAVQIGQSGFFLTAVSGMFKDFTEYLHEDSVASALEAMIPDCVAVYLASDKAAALSELLDLYTKKAEKGGSRLSRVYVRLVLLSLIIDEPHMSKEYIDGMLKVFNDYTMDDVEESRQLLEAFETRDKDKFDKLIKNCFYIYENELLVKLKDRFNSNKTEEEW